jgi:hypothetical protein
MKADIYLLKSIIDHPLWKADKFFSKGQALIDLHARGEKFKVSILELQNQWGWPNNKILFFLKSFNECGYLILNYKKSAKIFDIKFQNISLNKCYQYQTTDLRNTTEYKKWRVAVLKRDNYTCQYCPAKINLEAHHIKPYATHKNLRLIVKNGITLCATCHKKEHKVRSANG